MIKKIQTLYTKARSKPVGFSTDLVPSFLTALLLIMISMFMSSCSTQVILPGLCYDDRDGTHLCPKDSPPEQEEEDKPDMEELQPLYDYCEPWAQYETSEQWMKCIMNENKRRKLLIERLA